MKDTAIPQNPFICENGLLTVREQYEALLFSYKQKTELRKQFRFLRYKAKEILERGRKDKRERDTQGFSAFRRSVVA